MKLWKIRFSTLKTFRVHALYYSFFVKIFHLIFFIRFRFNDCNCSSFFFSFSFFFLEWLACSENISSIKKVQCFRQEKFRRLWNWRSMNCNNKIILSFIQFRRAIKSFAKDLISRKMKLQFVNWNFRVFAKTSLSIC